MLVYWLVTGPEVVLVALRLSPLSTSEDHSVLGTLDLNVIALRQELAFNLRWKEIGNRVLRTYEERREFMTPEQLPLEESVLYPTRYSMSTWSSLNCL